MRVVALVLVACSSAPAPKPVAPAPPDPHVQRLFPLTLAPRPELTAAIELPAWASPGPLEVVPGEFAISRALEHCGMSTLLPADERDPCEQALCEAGHHKVALALAAEARCTHGTGPRRMLLAAALAPELDAETAMREFRYALVLDRELGPALADDYRASGKIGEAEEIARAFPRPRDPAASCRRMISEGRTFGDPEDVIRQCAPYAAQNRDAVPEISLAAAYFGWPGESIPTPARWLKVARVAKQALPARDAAALELAALGNAAQVAMCRDSIAVDAIHDLATSLAEAVPDVRAAAEAIAARPCAYR